MDNLVDDLRYDERLILRLRSLYKGFGYTQYRMSRFEEYGLYADNKSFLASGDIITFTGAGGRLMALRPDVTLSIAKSSRDDGTLKKLYYNENVYRPDGHEFKEQMQVGLECIGDLNVDLMGETLMLAVRSLELLGKRTRLDISHMGFISALLNSAELSQAKKTELIKRISEKNVPGLNSLCDEYDLDERFREKLVALISLYGPLNKTFDALRQLSVNAETEAALCELKEIYDVLCRLDAEENISLDFSIVNDLSYYSGIIFQGYVEGIPVKVLSGGRYDELLRKFGKKSDAIGFAVYIDLLERYQPLNSVRETDAMTEDSQMVNIALPKGRLGENVYSLFASAGYGCQSINEESRRLVFEDYDNKVRYFWVKPSDVTIYVERGVADIGVVGKDIILENSPDVYELLDLGIGKCSVCVAAKRGFVTSDVDGRTLRVATTFAGIARDYYTKLGREIDIIKLYGSIELAPLLGLSDVIVDLVETGNTLRENNLEPIDTIVEISARLVANKASYKFKYEAISLLCNKIAKARKEI